MNRIHYLGQSPHGAAAKVHHATAQDTGIFNVSYSLPVHYERVSPSLPTSSAIETPEAKPESDIQGIDKHLVSLYTG